MRLRSLLLPTLALFAVSCQTSQPARDYEAEVSPPAELVDGTTGVENAFAVEPVAEPMNAEPVAAALRVVI